MNSKTKECVRCISCRYAKVDEKASDKNWTAYECGNEQSEYHKSLLNVTPNGDKQHRISWSGCEHGERRIL
jgi:hypothetical protein